MNPDQYSKAAYVGLHNALSDGTIKTAAERFALEDAIQESGSFEELPKWAQSILEPAFKAMEKHIRSLPPAGKPRRRLLRRPVRAPKSSPPMSSKPPWQTSPLQKMPDGSIVIPLCTGLTDGAEQEFTKPMQSKALDVNIKYKASRRPLRPEPYDPDAQDGDGDGIVQDGTAWERPVGTRILTELGREVARDMMTMRPSQLNRIVDSDGNDVDYTPKWRSGPSRPTIGDKPEVDRKPMDLPEIPPPDKGPKSPLGKIGAPTLKERGMPTVDEMLSPPPMQADAPPEA